MPKTREQDREYQRKRRALKAAGAQAPVVDSKPRSDRVHRSAVTRMLRATGLLHLPEEAPLVELLKTLAREIDEAPSASTASQYRVVISEVRKVLEVAAVPTCESTRVRGVQAADDAAGEGRRLS